MTSPAVQNNHETVIKRWRKVIRRAAAAMKESRRQDLLVLARVALEAAILDELVLLGSSSRIEAIADQVDASSDGAGIGDLRRLPGAKRKTSAPIEAYAFDPSPARHPRA
jgi:hypothetical protein